MKLFRNAEIVYAVVYAEGNEEARMIAVRTAELLQERGGLRAEARSDGEERSEFEILLGRTRFPETESAMRHLPSQDGYFVGCCGGRMVICATDRLGLGVGVALLLKRLEGAQGDNVEWDPAQNEIGSVAELERNDFLAYAVKVANRIHGTYSSFLEHKMATTKDYLADTADQTFIGELIERMGNSFAVCNGSPVALHRGKKLRLDPKDHHAVAYVDSDRVRIPRLFAERCFGMELSVEEDGCCDLQALCAETGRACFVDPVHEIAVVSPGGEEPFSAQDEIYLARMEKFFRDPCFPEPRNSVESTRIVVEQLRGADTRYVFDYSTALIDVLYSPAILVREEKGKRVLYAAYELATRWYMAKYKASPVYLKRSEDGGKTWDTVATVEAMHWASLADVKGKIYLIGNEGRVNNILVIEYDPATRRHRRASFDLKPGGGAPNTVLITEDRIYKAFNNAVASASLEDDLTKESSWVLSNDPQKLIPRERYEELTGLITNPKGLYLLEEGNVVRSPEGEIFVMYRVDANPTYGQVALFRLSKDGKCLLAEESTGGMLPFPYTQSKFSILYSKELGAYLSITSLSTMEHIHQRNVLGLVISKDLIHWDVVDTLLVDRTMMNAKCSMWLHAFQYVDLAFDGDDIVFFVREAMGDTILYHDANYMTLYRIDDYASFVRSRGFGKSNTVQK